MGLLCAGGPATVLAQQTDALGQARAEVMARRQAWQAAHRKAWQATVSKAACAPEFPQILKEAREAAARWVSATARGVDLWAIRRRATGQSYRPPVIAPPEELTALLETAALERSAAERMLAALTSTLVLERASQAAKAAVSRSEAETQAALESVRASTNQIPAGVADDEAAEALLTVAQGPRTVDLERITEFYDQLEALAQQRCQVTSERPLDPFSLPARAKPAREGTKQ